MSNRGLYISPADRKALVGLSKSAHLVFYCYVSYRNKDSWEAWPKISTISDKTGISRNTINKAIPKLKERKLLRFAGTVKGFICKYKVGVHRSSEYRGGYYMPLEVLEVLSQAKGGLAFDVLLLLAQKGYAKEGRSISIVRTDIMERLSASKRNITRALTQLRELGLLETIDSLGIKPKYRIGASVLHGREVQGEKYTDEHSVDLASEGSLGVDKNGLPTLDKNGLTLDKNVSYPRQKWLNPSTKMFHTLDKNGTHKKSNNKSNTISIELKGGAPPLEDRQISTNDQRQIPGNWNQREGTEGVSKLTNQNKLSLWMSALFECHERRHGWKFYGLEPLMDIYSEIDWPNRSDNVDWFIFCVKEIDVWLNRTYEKNGNKAIWSDNKWIGGIKNWLYRNRNKPVKSVRASKLSICSLKPNKSQPDLEHQEESPKDAKLLYDASPTPERLMYCELMSLESHDARMEAVRTMIKTQDISKASYRAIQADSELGDFLDLIETSGYCRRLS